MKRTPDWVAIDDLELFEHGITKRDFNLEDVEYDPASARLWIDPNSKTATVLSLKGCKFRYFNHESVSCDK